MACPKALMLKSKEIPTSCEQLQCLSTRLGRTQQSFKLLHSVPHSPQVAPYGCPAVLQACPSLIASLVCNSRTTAARAAASIGPIPGAQSAQSLGDSQCAGRCTHSLLYGYNSEMDIETGPKCVGMHFIWHCLRRRRTKNNKPVHLTFYTS